MKKRRFAAIFAAFVLTMNLAACKQSTTTEPETPNTPPSSDTTQTEEQPNVSLQEKDAASIAQEKLPEGYTAAANGTVEVRTNPNEPEVKYYVYDVTDASGNSIGQIAIDQNSGERYNYADGKISDYQDFALYDATSDAECDWNGVFKNDTMSVELLQEDQQSFWFTFSDGTEGVARVSGNTGAATDSNLLFTMKDNTTLTVSGDDGTYSGVFTLDPNA